MYSECILIPANFKYKETYVYYSFLDICADLSYLQKTGYCLEAGMF